MRLNAGFAGRVSAVGLLALAGVAAAAGGASAGTVASCTATGTATGPSASCTARATLSHPKSISVTVTSTPNEELVVGWQMLCYQGSKHANTEGSYLLDTPVTETMKLPYANATTCYVTAQADNDIIVESARAQV